MGWKEFSKFFTLSESVLRQSLRIICILLMQLRNTHYHAMLIFDASNDDDDDDGDDGGCPQQPECVE